MAGSQVLLIFLAVCSTVVWICEACGGGGGGECTKKDCVMGEWTSWSFCSTTCGPGQKSRTRTKKSDEDCGGKQCSDFNTTESSPCNVKCCPVDCQLSWTSWSSCSVTCGNGTQNRRQKITMKEVCGGQCKRTTSSRSCGDERCCPVNCAVGSWGSWGACNAACEKTGNRRRTRPVRTQPTCRGTPCPTLTDSKSCSGPCCPRNCVPSSWSSWGKCSSGSCAKNSGTQSRSRQIKTAQSCGGSCSVSLKASQRCTPIPVSCLMSSWGGWQSCIASNGKCGPGSQKRIRKVIRPNYCSTACPSTQETRSCTHSCCPVNCVMNNWKAWSSCSSTCGIGTIKRSRTVKINPSCGGQACPSLTETKSCQQYNNKDCVMGAWSAWSVCDNGCGTGRTRKTRAIVSREACRGRKCSYTQAFKTCTDYRNNTNCQVSQWSSWTACDQKCSVGTKQRTRKVTVPQRCRGNKCPALKESSQCGSANNGCQHRCTNGVCSCNPGYNLFGSKQCVAKDCGQLSLTYCAPGTRNGTTCLYAKVSCPKAKTDYPVKCSIVCPSTYAVKGVTSVSCTAAGSWSTTAKTYCRRINDPPTQLVLSGSHSVAENLPRNTLVGVLSSTDPNSGDSHSYSLTNGGGGKFVIRGNKLYTTGVLDYETMTKRYDLTIRSTDSGNPPFYLEKTFTVLLSDVNEQPTGIQLSSSRVNENSDINTALGTLSTIDQDTGQTYTYTMVDTANGRFKIDGNTVKVAMSNTKCLSNGGHFCAINYETNKYFTITVQSMDSGTPSLSVNATLNITVVDKNDQPRGLGLSNNTVKENAIKGHVIGRFFAQDEDAGQSLKYSLSQDDQGRFGVRPNGELVKLLDTDYEKNTTHSITAVVEDNGNPRMKMERRFLIEVLDVNEPPIAIHLNDNDGQQQFPLDHAQIAENSNYSTVVGTLLATDNDRKQTLTFTLDSDASGVFSLSRTSCPGNSKKSVCTTKLLVSGDIDYETSSSLGILVRVTDQHGKFKVHNFKISVKDINEQPTNVTISGGLVASVAENSAGAFIGELVTSDEDQNQTYTYTLLSGNVFEIRGNKIYVTNSLDFETKNQYVVKVTTTDDGIPPLTSSPQTFVIHVLDRNEAPTEITLSQHAVYENSAAGTIIGNLTVDDPDNSGKYSSRQSHVCQLSNSAQGKFNVVRRSKRNYLVQSASSLNYETASSHNVSVLCRDPGGLTLERNFMISVLDINEAPTKISLSKTQLSENLPAGIVGVLSTQDPDNLSNKYRQTFNYSLSNTTLSTSPFTIDRDFLKTTRSLNYETARSWTIVVRAQDSGTPRLSREETIVVDVIDMNDQPTAIQLSNVQVEENSGVGTLVGRVATNDEDIGQNHSYQIIDSASGRFKIHNDSVVVSLDNTRCLQYGGTACLLNYEQQPSYNTTIRTTDNGSPRSSFDQTFQIFLVDVNDQPRDLRLTNHQVKENSSIGTVIGSFSARDEDARQMLHFLLVDDDRGRFAVNNKGELLTARTLDHEAAKNHVIRARVTDNGYIPKKLERNFTIEVLNINEAPIGIDFSGGHPPLVAENTTIGTTIGELRARDSDANQNLTFQLVDDSRGEFALVQSTSQCQSPGGTVCTVNLRLSKGLNYEVASVRFITVRVTDNHGLFKVQDFSINVTDCNDAPTNLTLNGGVSAVVNENEKGVFVGELQTSDEDSSQTWRYVIVVGSTAMFRIVGSKLFVSLGKSLDYEKQSDHVVTVTSTDSGSPSFSITRNFTIFVADVNERPTKIMVTGNKIVENSSPGTVIANITVKDPDNTAVARQTHTCSVIGQNRNMFEVKNSLVLVNTVVLDYERLPVVNITIECTDSGTPSLKYQDDFTVVVLDQNEAPTDLLVSNLNVQENQPPGSIATLSTIDPDNSMTTRQTFKYKISTDSPPVFVIDGDNLNTTRELDYEAKSSWNITITSTDSGNLPLAITKSFVVNVQDVNEAPTLITLSPSKVDENSNENTLVGTLTTTDEDKGQRHRYILVEDSKGRFKLVNNSELRIALSNTDCLLHGGKHCGLNYEAQSVYPIRVRSTDDGSPAKRYVMTLNITLRDVNDKPRDLTLSNHLVKENATLNTTIGYLTASDEDRQELSYRLVKNVHGLFDVSNDGRLFVVKSLNHEKESAVDITVKVTDSGTPVQWMIKQFKVVIENVNEAPVNTTFTSKDGQQSFNDNSPVVDENSPVGTVVGTIVALDPDAGQHLTFTLDDSSDGSFSVNTPSCYNVTDLPGIKTRCVCQLSVNSHLNYEDISQHSIIVRVTDNFNHSHVTSYVVTVLDQNDQPSNITLQGSLTGQVHENSNGALIGGLVTSDEDSSQTHTYALTNSSNSRFTLRGSMLYTSKTANLDYEEQQEFEVVVSSTDDGKPRKSVEQRLNIQVQDVNEHPTNITLSGLSVKENSNEGIFIANITVTDPDNFGPKGIWQTHSCKLLDSAQNRFKIISDNMLYVDTGELNYEQSSSHNIIIKCVDSAVNSLSLTKSFVIDVVDINEKPLQITLSTNEVPENSGPLLVGQLASTDPDNEQIKRQSFTYSLEAGNDEKKFVISGSQLRTNTSLNYEIQSSWQLAIKTTDPGGLSFVQNFTVTVRDMNDQPTDILSSRPLSVFENSLAGSPITVFSAVDEDIGQSHRFYINHVSGPDGKSYPKPSSIFPLDASSGRLLVTSPIDYETTPYFSIEIMTQDNGHPSFSFNKTFTIKVYDVNELPDAIIIDNATIAENSEQGSIVGNLTVSDPDNIHEIRQHYNCKVVNDVPFKVSKMQLVVAQAILDYESKNYYKVKMNCSQVGNVTIHISSILLVFVSDLNEPPFNLNISNTAVEENIESIPSFVGTISAQDPDDNNVVYSLVKDGEGSEAFFVNGTSFFASKTFDYETKNHYLVTLMATDDGNPTLNTTKQFNIKILDKNDRPVKIILFSSGVYENATEGTVVGNLSTIDMDKGQQHVYNILDWNELFMIDGNQLVLNQSGVLNFEETSFINVTVETTDNGTPSKSYTELLVVTVLDANDRPSNITASVPLSVLENTQGYTNIMFVVEDEDRKQSHHCSVRDLGEAFFEIAHVNGSSVLRVKDGVVLDYETNEYVKISLFCTDNGKPPLSVTKNFTISVIDVNEPPISIQLLGRTYVHENDQPVYSLGVLHCNDTDGNQTCSFEVIGEYSDTFRVQKGNNSFVVISNKKLDYETLNSPNITVEVRATDDGNPPKSLISNISLTVIEVNEIANKIELHPGNITLNETTPIGTNISELICNNPEPWQMLEYILLSHQDLFMIKTIKYNMTYDAAILGQNGVKQSTFEISKSFLFLRSNLSHDKEDECDILVQVMDNGRPQLSFSDTVKVRVAMVDPCLPENHCSENANCIRLNGFDYSCSCNNGFTGNGINCTEIDDCVHSSTLCDNTTRIADPEKKCKPCNNDGVCHDEHLTFNCTCAPGFTGTRCETDINECVNVTGLPQCIHGICHDAINNFTCACDRGYTDWLCDGNIDDCASEPCGEHGNCIDGVASYTCSCSEGFTGPRCRRPLTQCEEARCLPRQHCIPYRLHPKHSSKPKEPKQNSKNREKSTQNPEGNSESNSENREETTENPEDNSENENPTGEVIIRSKDICFSGENVSTIYLAKNLTETLKLANSSLEENIGVIRIALEDWILRYVQVYYQYTELDRVFMFFNLSDVSVLEITETSENIAVTLVARVDGVALSQRGLVCSIAYVLNNASVPQNRSSCLAKVEPKQFYSFTSNYFNYYDYLFPTACDIERFECIDPKPLVGASGGDGSKPITNLVIYVLAGVGFVLFVLVVCFAFRGDRSHKFNMQEALRRRQQYDHVRLPEEDESYCDVMFRHHINTAMANAGTINPLYGLEEDNDDAQMIENPLYGTARRDDTSAFANPLYESVQAQPQAFFEGTEREPSLRAKPVSKYDL